MSVPFTVELSTIVTNMDGEGNHCSIHSNILRSVCCVPSHRLGSGMSSSRWIDSKNRRWESSHHSWRHGSGTAATHSANSLSQFGTIANCSGGGEYSDHQAAVERRLQAPRKPTRSESLDRGFHIEEDCHHGHSGQSHGLDKHDFGRPTPWDCPILSVSSPRTTIRIRPPTKPVRRNSCEWACGTI